jgi:KDO2-lipid IV(A) lauroyltransferase
VNVDGQASRLPLAAPCQSRRARHQREQRARAGLRDLRFRLEYAALRGAIALMRLVPLRLSVRWSATLWRILAPRLNPKRQQIALENLRIAFPDKGEQERLAICMAHWENLGRVVVEMVQMDRLLRDPSRIEIPDQHLLARYRDKLGPLIGVSLHMGNWELAIWPLVVAGANPAALYRAVGNPYINQYLKAKRRALYPAGLIGRRRPDASPLEDLQTAHRLMDYVRAGGRAGIVCDQYYKRGVPVPFFGRTTLAPPITAIIARRIGARLWMARCLRIGAESRFRIEIKELRIPRTASQADDVRWALEAIHRQFESWIREAPGQWLWSHKIWR